MLPIPEMLDFTVHGTMVLVSTGAERSEINRLILPSVEPHAIMNLWYTQGQLRGACCKSSTCYGASGISNVWILVVC
jgi:hypothetical protein